MADDSLDAMLDTVGIRIAGDADIESVRRLLSPLESVLWQPNDSYTYVAEDEAIFGAISVSDVSQPLFDSETGEVVLWFVDDAHAMRGIGRKLLVHGLTVLKRRGFEKAIMWLPQNAERAIQIARKVAFESTGHERVSNIKTGSVNAIAMRKDLSKFF